MHITINGEKKEFAAPMPVSELVSVLGLDTRKVAIERNLEIVPRSVYESVALQEGDAIEIVQFIGGG